ncbi:hypothetical protein KR038_001925 [Drosophila bunnanda]|nr:hypothetical protein KR038_001925 [Drosophila bunnanda]
MEYSGIELPGIVSPDENVEHFAKLYGNESLGMMLMASTIGNSYDMPGKPRFQNLNRPAYDDQSFKTSSRNGLQSGSRAMRHSNHYNPPPAMEPHYPRYMQHKEGCTFPRAALGSRSMGRGGYGDHYSPSSAMQHHNPTHSHQQEGFAFPRASLGSRSMRHGGYGDHYTQQARQFPIPEHQNLYSFAPPQRYAWL